MRVNLTIILKDSFNAVLVKNSLKNSDNLYISSKTTV